MRTIFTSVRWGDFGKVWYLVWRAQTVLRLAFLLVWHEYLDIFLWWLSTIVECSGRFPAAICTISISPPSWTLDHCNLLHPHDFCKSHKCDMNVSHHTKAWTEFGCPTISTKNTCSVKKHMSIVDVQVWILDGKKIGKRFVHRPRRWALL